jgi:hypothetical protein
MTPSQQSPLKLGDWRTALADVQCDALITDPPYGARTHAASTTRNDGTDPDGLTPDYAPWTADDVQEFVASWSPRCRGWMLCLTDDSLIDAYRAAYRSAGRFDFHPVPCVIRGMSCRMQGDGPSSEAIYAMISRPRTIEFIGGWTRPGAYVGNSVRLERAGGSASGKGRGKPPWLEHAFVRHYSLPGWTVCDPLAGFGGVLVAALGLGRLAIGSELDAGAHAVAMRRIARPLQVDMFSTQESA